MQYQNYHEGIKFYEQALALEKIMLKPIMKLAFVIIKFLNMN